MASRSALIALLVVLSCAAAASAVTFNVGDNSGWTTSVDYNNWLSGKTFAVGDQLVFSFTTGSHDVVEVNKSGYDGCSTSNAVNTIQTGPATVPLTSSGTHYYICGIPGHCGLGMKLAVNVGSGSGSSPSPAPPTPGASPSTPTPSAPATPPAGASVRLTAGPALAVAAAAALALF